MEYSQRRRKVVSVVFYRGANGSEPVRKWLKSLPKENRRIIGEDIKTVEWGWPLGMPLVRNLGNGLWEVIPIPKNKDIIWSGLPAVGLVFDLANYQVGLDLQTFAYSRNLRPNYVFIFWDWYKE